MNMVKIIQDDAIKLLKSVSMLKNENLESTLDIPPQKEFGDLATNICFSLARKLKKSPQKIAEEIVNKIKIPKNSVISKLEAKGGYVNFFLNYEEIGKDLLQVILKEKEKYGSSNLDRKQKIMIEYSAPNPNKPMHIGHARNNFIGISINNILSFAGFDAHPVNQINDRGVHICKSLWGYLQFGKKDESKKIKPWKKLLDEWYDNQNKWLSPKDVNKKPDYFVMDFYVKANNLLEENEEYDKQNRELLQEWENENPKVRKLWEKSNSWVYKGWDETYRRQGCFFERYYYESILYKKGKKIVFKNMDKGIFVKTDKGTIIADLEKHGLPGLVFIRSDGTSLYQTYDLALTEQKVKDYPKAKLIWVVGGSHKLYFQQLFMLFDLLGLIKKEDCYHLGYGMISLP
jgi:arginyl-tRNA synthetase